MNIDSLARFKAKKEAGNFCQIPSNIAIQKLNYHILSQITKKTQWHKTNVKNELTILRTIIMVKFNNKITQISGTTNSNENNF